MALAVYTLPNAPPELDRNESTGRKSSVPLHDRARAMDGGLLRTVEAARGVDVPRAERGRQAAYPTIRADMATHDVDAPQEAPGAGQCE